MTFKINVKLALLLTVITAGVLNAAPTPVGPIGFGKGLNVNTIATDIADDQSPDLCNSIPDKKGGAFKRNGTKRYIQQAISSHPVTSIYPAYASTGTEVKKALLVTNKDGIFVSTGDVTPVWVKVSSGLNPNQHWNWITMNGKAIGTGDGLTDPIKQYDVLSASMTDLFQGADAASTTVLLKARHSVMSKNYYIVGNVRSYNTLNSGTTDYPSHIFFSLLNQPSSMTAVRFIEIRTGDGEEITGLGTMFDKVNIFKESSIHELSFTVLNLRTQGGDWVLSEVVDGFGVIAPRTLANTGQFYVFLSKDGVRLWDGGRRSRLNVTEESRIISDDIKPIIDSIISAGTYKSAVGVYYPKQEWYVLSYEDPTKFPRGRNNSTIIYDFATAQWYPICNWLVDSFAVQDGGGDKGQLLYGDAGDGYVHMADVPTRTDDSRKEIALDPMDNPYSWAGSTIDAVNVREGTASLKVSVSASVAIASMTRMGIFPVGEWYDKTKVTRQDKLAFKAFPSGLGNLSSLRVDLQVNDSDQFDNFFTSVTLTSAAFNTSGWTTFEIPLSSFPVADTWVSLSSEAVPFANTLTYYGIRFAARGIGTANISIDDLRVIQATENPNKMYRTTKLFNLGTVSDKTFGSILLTREKSPDAAFSMDIYNDFGKKVRTVEYGADIPKEIFALGYASGTNVTALNASDLSVLRSSEVPDSVWSAYNGAADASNVYFYDRTRERQIHMNRNTFLIGSSYGALGSGTTNFNLVHQQAVDDDYIYMVDMNNQRVKAHSKTNGAFIRMAGSLGTNATNYHQPTGIAVDDAYLYVADEGNYRLLKLDKSTFGFVLSVEIDYNTIGDSTLAVDERDLFVAYNKVSDEDDVYQDVILEKRDKGSLSLLNRVRVQPEGSVANSTYTLVGDIAMLGKYVYVSFTDDGNFGGSGSHYIQKRLKSDFSLVKEYKSQKRHYSLIGDGLSWKPAIKTDKKSLDTSGKYIQLRFYDSALDNNWKLFNQTFLLTEQGLTY